MVLIAKFKKPAATNAEERKPATPAQFITMAGQAPPIEDVATAMRIEAEWKARRALEAKPETIARTLDQKAQVQSSGDSNTVKRARIVRSVMTSGASDFRHRAKVLELAQKLDNAGIKLPVPKKEKHGTWEPKTFMEVAQEPKRLHYKRIFDPRNSALVRDLRPR